MAITLRQVRNLEAEVFVRAEFSFQISSNGTVSIHTETREEHDTTEGTKMERIKCLSVADCGTGTLISGLKSDFKSLFGDPESQEWFHRTRKLVDSKRLKDYDIDGKDGATIKLYVRQTRPETIK